MDADTGVEKMSKLTTFAVFCGVFLVMGLSPVWEHDRCDKAFQCDIDLQEMCGKIAFDTDKDGNWEVYVIDVH